MKVKCEKNMFFKSLRIFRLANLTLIASLIIGAIFWGIIKFAIFFARNTMNFLKELPTELYLFSVFGVLFAFYLGEENSVKKDILFLGLFIYTASAIYLNDCHLFLFKYLQIFISF